VRQPTEKDLRRRGDFGLRVRELRAPLGLSQEDLAHQAGLHRTYIGAIERGERNLSIDNIYAIADALGCDVTDLFGSS
jgi:transcriptional regulator with XRE-family HTH domain